MAAGQKLIEIRPLAQTEEVKAAVALQQSIWGFDDIELLPVRLFVTAQKIGGQAFGAFDGEKLVGFCLAIPGIKPGGRAYLHSHMVGVAPEYRDYGIGRMIKLRQREDALARSIDLMEWTFDPLEIKNAYFNIERLGAIVRRYVRNQYGVTSSRLHGGLPTDRCFAEWWLGSDRVGSVLAGNPPPRPEIEARITVPAGFAEIRIREPKRAKLIQSEISAQFEKHFERGLAVIGFDRTPEHGAYLFASPKKP